MHHPARFIPTLLLVALAGCSAGGPESTAPAIRPAVHAGLVLPGAAPGRLAPSVEAWEYARNDPEMGAPPRPLDPQVAMSETLKRQRRTISSGRLRENTTLTTRTYGRRSGR